MHKRAWREYTCANTRGTTCPYLARRPCNTTLIKFSMKERSAEIFVTVSMYRAKSGEEDAIIALHEDW